MTGHTVQDSAMLVHALPCATTINDHIGKRLRRRRRLLGWTLQNLADASGLHAQQLYKYECGASRVPASRLVALSVALRMPLDYFFAGLIGADELKCGSPNERESEEINRLIRAYYALPQGARGKFVDLAQSFAPDAAA